MDEDLHLDEIEARVLGVLVEKQLTTPDQYPLTVNAATSGCNQKSNREPVMDLAESQVQHSLEKLMVRGYVGLVHAAGGRTDRYRHNLAEHLQLSQQQLALLAVMLLRGPQTAGELKTRCARMFEFDSPAAVDPVAGSLIEAGYAVRLAPAPGSRAARYAQLLSPDSHAHEAAQTAPASPPQAGGAPSLAQRLSDLESEVAELRTELQRLTDQLGG
ncbi:MAG: DUF480 domain-containing protein [Planctomycetes bacterium]|nr:DUF480 domain-containing protein [Planctomycetota bacterium]